jgi:hypothetical protein
MALTSYVFDLVADAAHVVEAVGKALVEMFTMTFAARDGVTIDPIGSVEYAAGTVVPVTVTALPGFEIAQILVDGVPLELPAA